ncbi:MAG: transcriptional regulator [Bacilli bacterium]|nr:transcriptional regulator [Bacilli bacterium]
MEETLYITNLYEYYKELLTEKEKSYFEDYYYENLTMEEIADNNEISKNAISKTLKEVKNKLNDYESKLNLKSNYDTIKKILSIEDFSKIEKYI